mmetsp:Transcript_43705/g.52850  ORF Transcript_43705/g.52850 Transcript_43705/m.52850 type:complete len:184 (-) Transcript_43705:147-698(-)
MRHSWTFAVLLLLCVETADGAWGSFQVSAQRQHWYTGRMTPGNSTIQAQQVMHGRKLAEKIQNSHWNCHFDCQELGNHNLPKCRFCCPSYCSLEVHNNLRACERCCPRYCARGSRSYGSTYGEKLACRGCCPRYCLLPQHADKIACEGCCPHYCQKASLASKKACDGTKPAPFTGRYMKSNFC